MIHDLANRLMWASSVPFIIGLILTVDGICRLFGYGSGPGGAAVALLILGPVVALLAVHEAMFARRAMRVAKECDVELPYERD